jgi:hypothetical protein
MQTAFDLQEEDHASIKMEVKDDTYKVTLSQKGNASEIMESNKTIFGTSGTLAVSEDKGFAALKHKTGYYEQFDYSGLLKYVTDDFELDYTVKTGMLNGIDKAYKKDYNTVKGGTYQTTFDKLRGSISFTGNKWNIAGILCWWIVLAGLVFSIVGILVTNALSMVSDKMKSVKKQKPVNTESAPAQPVQPVQPAQPVQPVQPAQPAQPVQPVQPEYIFCPECGKRYEKGTAFCENCGTKLN